MDNLDDQDKQKEDAREINKEQMTGRDALFALIGIRMMKLS